MTRLRVILTAFLLTALAVPATAFGGSNPSADLGTAQGAQDELTSQSGALPFTGLNLVLILVGGAVLIATGLLLRHRSSSTR